MKVIFIDAENRTVEEKRIVGSLDSMQKLCGGLIDVVRLKKNDLFVNDEGMYLYQHGFMFRYEGQTMQLYGSGFICSVNHNTGNSIDYDKSEFTVEQLKEKIVFWQHAKSGILNS